MKPIVAAVLLLFFFLSGCTQTLPFSLPKWGSALPSVVCLGVHCVNAEIADTPEKRAEGLMNRETLEKNEGMLFIFDEEGLHGFWMKNTLIPLDAVWISSDLRVVDIKRMEPCLREPCPVYIPKGNAQYVLEIPANTAQEWKTQMGDTVSVGIRK